MESVVLSSIPDFTSEESSSSESAGAISFKHASTTCRAFLVYCRFVRSDASVHGVSKEWRIGLISLEARNSFSFSLGDPLFS